MKNLAELKRLEVGSKIKLIKYGFGKHKNLRIIRTIVQKQTNVIVFEDRSWLYYPKANEFKPTEKGFIILEKKSTDIKLQDILKKEIENGKYVKQPNKENNNKNGLIARHKDKFYYIPNENINKAREKAKTYQENIELLEYESIK